MPISKYCARCSSIQPLSHTHRAPDTRPSASRRGYGSEWRKTRKAFLEANPICQDPSGCIARATDVDHKDGKGPLGPKGHDWGNLRAFCHSHHSRRTARDQPGGWNA